MEGYAVSGSRLRFRVVAGVKKPGDLRLDWLTPDGWEPVPMRAIGMIHAFFVENEDHLYPPAHGWLGGDYWRAWLRICEDDWKAASKKLAEEKAWAERRARGAA